MKGKEPLEEFLYQRTVRHLESASSGEKPCEIEGTTYVDDGS